MSKVYGLMADVHLHDWSAFSFTNDRGLNNRMDGLLREIVRCAKEVKEAGGSHIVIAGDVFHVRGSVAPSVLNPTIDTLRWIRSELDVSAIILAGNHDLQHKEATRMGSAITALEGAGAQVVNEPTYFKEVRAVLVPWIENVETLKEVIGKLGTGDMDKFLREGTDLILHAPIDGVIKGLPEHGLTPEWLASLGYKRVASGHYHNHKRFDGEVYSIGALAHHTWGDVSSRAGYLMVYPDRVDYRKSHLPEFIDLSKISPDDEDDIALLVDGNYVRVRVEAVKSKEVEEARAELLAMGARAVLVQSEPKPPADEVRATHSVTAGASLEVSVSEFIGGMKSGIPLEDINREAISVLSSVGVV